MELEIFDFENIQKKIQIVENLLHGKKILVAFSGGVDSSVVSFLASQYAKSVLLVMQDGLSVGIGEKDFAVKQAKQLGVSLEVIEYNEIDYSDEYQRNPENRCYYCKQVLHEFLDKIKEDRNFDLVISGTNYSDLKGHRPGHVATLEKGVMNPMVIAKITKQEVRWIAEINGLISFDRPATACLASRFKTGVKITKEGLLRVAKSEDFIKSEFKLKSIRVRDDGQDIARIEFMKEDLILIKNTRMIDEIREKLRSYGYHKIILDKIGYRPSVPSI